MAFGKKKEVETAKEPAIEDMPLTSLLEQRVKIDAMIAAKGADHAEKEKSKMLALCSALGISIKQLFDLRDATADEPKRQKKKREGRLHRDPVTGEEWHGLGRRPPWLMAYIEQGRDPADFVVTENKQP